MAQHTEDLGLTNLRGDDLVERLSELLHQQNSKIAKLEASLELLRIYQENSDTLLHADEILKITEPELATSFVTGAEDHFSRMEGFHGLEFGADGKAYRWAGETGTVSFHCYVNRGVRLRATLELFNAVHPDTIPNATLYEGNDALTLKVKDSEDKPWPQLTTVLPIKKKASGMTVLRYKFPHSKQLTDADTRIASVAFHRFSLLPVEQE